MKLLSNKSLLIIFILIYRLLLEYSYINIVSPVFAYNGYNLDFEFVNYAFSWVFFTLSLFFVKERVEKVGDFFFITAVLLVITPMTVLYGYDSQRPLFPLLVTFLSISLVFFIAVSRSISFRTLPTVKGGKTLVIGMSMVFVLFLVVWYYLVGVSFNLDFKKVYEFRDANADLSSSGILAYTNSWTLKIFNIVLFAFALLHRRYFFAVIVFIIQVYFFAATAHKSVFFLPIMVLGIWWFFKKTNSLLILPIGLCGIVILTLISNALFDEVFTSSLFVRRLLFVPAHLSYAYFEFFGQNEHIYWSNSVLSSFFTYPYNLSISHVIGNFLGDEELGANNGYVSSGFAHAGLWGVAIYSVLIGFMIKFLNDVTSNTLPLWLAISLSIIPLRALLVASDLLTVMFTHGFLVALMIIFFARTRNSST